MGCNKNKKYKLGYGTYLALSFSAFITVLNLIAHINMVEKPIANESLVRPKLTLK